MMEGEEGENGEKLSGNEVQSVIDHFFGGSPQIPSDHPRLSTFLKWFISTTEKLLEEPLNYLFNKGFIRVYLSTDDTNDILSDEKVGSFILMCTMNVPGNLGIIIKTEHGIVRRPLVCCSSTPKEVVLRLNKHEDLKYVFRLQEDLKHGFFPKSCILEEELEADGEEEEYPGVPIVM